MLRPALAALLVAACSGPTEQSGPPPLLTRLPRELTSSEAALVAANNRFAFDLLHRMQEATPADNIVLSPTSASMALGMTLNGAGGATLDAMRSALRVEGQSLQDINAGYRGLIDLLKDLDERVAFTIANSIWTHAGMTFAPAFLDAARTAFDAEIRSLDFGAPSTLDAINGWVRDRTGGRIPVMLDAIASDEVMFLLNAIYFKGAWRLAFDPKRTTDQAFHAADGTTKSVPTMGLEPQPLRHAFADGRHLVELLYGNGAFAMTLVLPREGESPAALVAGLGDGDWNAWLAALTEQKIGLNLPKFRLELARELERELSDLGMAVAFDAGRADFSGMASGIRPGDLYLTRVTQKTFLNVDEEGTTAAAATSVGVGITSAPPTVSFDRPFLFAIRERFSGTILFVGQVARL